MSPRQRFCRWLRRRINTSFDNRLEAFILSLFEIEGVKDFLLDFSKGRLVRFQIRTIVELIDLKQTLINSYIPNAVRSANVVRKRAAKSKYRNYFTNVIFEDRVHEVIRHGYVNVFHKLEGYREELVGLVNQRGQELYGKNVDIAAYLKRVHSFKLDDLSNYPETIQRVNWIGNCVKHYGGYPKKKNPPVTCQGMDATKKIVLSKEDLARDIDFVLEYTTRLFKFSMLALACARLEEIFDNSDSATRCKLLPSIGLIITTAVVYRHTLKDESDEDFGDKLESFIKGWTMFQKNK